MSFSTTHPGELGRRACRMSLTQEAQSTAHRAEGFTVSGDRSSEGLISRLKRGSCVVQFLIGEGQRSACRFGIETTGDHA